MWILFGLIAAIATMTNLSMYMTGKDYKWAMATALSFTAITLCATQSMVANWVTGNDWVALLDVVPTLEITLWIATILAIILNMLPLLFERKRPIPPSKKSIQS